MNSKQGITYIFVLISLIALAAPTKKQLTLLKNDVVAVKATLKSGKNLESSEATVRKYLADTVYCSKEQGSSSKELELQGLLCEVLSKAYQVDNEKLYLKEALDTTNLFEKGCRMFLAYQKLDSLDSKDRKKNSQYLLPYRANIFMGGLYFTHKKSWQQAWICFDIYLQCAKEPLFSDCKLSTDDELTHRVEYLSLIASTHMDSLALAKKYAQGALLSNQKEKALQSLAEITIAHKDNAEAEKYLKEGFKEYPLSDFFFAHLLDKLNNEGRVEEAYKLCNEAVSLDSTKTMFQLGLHNLLMEKKSYDEAVKVGDRVIALNDSIDTPYYNIGFVYHKNAIKELNKPGVPYRQRLTKAQALFRKCRKYMERYRQLRPYDKSHWRPILYDVYLNLNMGKEFAEVSN